MTDPKEQEIQPTGGDEQVVPNQPEEHQSEGLTLNFVLPNSLKISLPLHGKDFFQDVRQFILELPEAYFFTSYHFSFEGKKISDLAEIASVEGIKDGADILLVEDLYSEKDAKIHIHRIKNLLEADLDSAGFAEFAGVAAFSKLVQSSEPKEVLAGTGLLEPLKLSLFYPPGFDTPAPKCYHSLTTSAWNPPPRYRQANGDLFYLVYESLDKKEHHITASSLGFFLNGSTRTVFNPTPNTSAFAHSLFDLLCIIDPALKTRYAAFQESVAKQNVFEAVPFTGPAAPWCVPKATHTANQSRAEDFAAGKLDGVEFPGQVRDWNEEFQSCRELPRATLAERIVRERALHKINADFLEAAKRGAMAVVGGNVPPLNPNEPPASRMYLYHNIFFSYAVDGRDTFKNMGGNAAAHAAANKDLQAVNAFNSLELGEFDEKTGLVLGGIHTPLTAIIDYRGNRLVAQSMIPGILRHDQNTAVRYGGIDSGKQIRADPQFHALLETAADALHIAKHTLVDGEGKEVELATSAEFKGIVGGDDRKYLLDLYRATPVDANFVSTAPDQPPKMASYLHQLTLLRLELIGQFFENKYLNFLKDKIAEKTKEKQEKKEGAAPAEADGKAEGKTEGAEEAADLPLNFGEEELKYSLALNPDVFTHLTLGGSEEKIAEDCKLVIEAADYLLTVVIPSLVNDFFTYQSTPMDSESLRDTLHSRGINMRYLGKMVKVMEETEKTDATGKAARRFEPFKNLCTQEMIIRGAKHAFRNYIATTPAPLLSSRIAHFLNCLLGNTESSQIDIPAIVSGLKGKKAPAEPKPQEAQTEEKANGSASGKSNKKKKAANKAAAVATTDATSSPPALPFANILSELPPLNHATLWKELRQQIKSRFLFDLPLDEKETKGVKLIRQLPALRSFCRAVGIQIAARDYDFAAKGPVFLPADIIAVIPVVKSISTRAQDAKELFDAAKVQQSQGKYQVAAELASEALAIYQQVYGAIHADIMACQSTLSLIYYQSGDLEQAIAQQERAVIISERVNGLDNPETFRLYTNLGVLYYGQEKPDLALLFIARARFLAQIIYGPDHPELISSDSNIALMLQSMGDFATSQKLLKHVVEMEERLFGPDNVTTANGYHALAKNCGLLGEYKEGLGYERQAYAVFSRIFGAEDPRSQESSLWMNKLAQNAVITEKNKKELQWTQGGSGANPKKNPLLGSQGSSSSKNKNKKKK